MHTEGMLIKQEGYWALITKKDEERHQLFMQTMRHWQT